MHCSSVLVIENLLNIIYHVNKASGTFCVDILQVVGHPCWMAITLEVKGAFL